MLTDEQFEWTSHHPGTEIHSVEVVEVVEDVMEAEVDVVEEMEEEVEEMAVEEEVAVEVELPIWRSVKTKGQLSQVQGKR